MGAREDKIFADIMAAAATGRMLTDEEVAAMEAILAGKPVHEPMPADIRPIDVDVAPGEVGVASAAPDAEAEDLLKGVYEPRPRKMYAGSGLSKENVFGRKAAGHSASSVWMDMFGGGWWDDKQDQQAALKAVQRAANVLQNSADGEEKQIDAKWSDGKKVNRAGDPTVWLSPDIPIKDASLRSDWSDAERNDVLVAEALAESAMKRTMDPAVEDKMARAGKSKFLRRTTARIWTAAERIAAEEEVARDYPGFRSYFAAHRQYFTSDQAWQQCRTW